MGQGIGRPVSTRGDDRSVAARLGLTAGMVVQELGWDEDCDDDLRAGIEKAIGGELVDDEFEDVADVVLLWWRDGDGDLVDALMDSLTDLGGGGAIWLLTPKIGRPRHVEPGEISDSAPTAGLLTTTSISAGRDWTATRLVAPRNARGTRRG